MAAPSAIRGRELRSRSGDVLAAARAAVERILANAGPEGFAAAVRGNPVARLLFQARSGRLDQAALIRACSTPRRMLEIAGHLGVAVAAPPPGS